MATSTSRFSALLTLALIALAASSPALAQDSIGSMADGVVNKGTFTAILDLFGGICYLIGAVFGIKSALQLRDHTNNPGQVKISTPLVSMLVSSVLLTVPTLFLALQTTFGLQGDNLGGLAALSGGAPAGGAQDLSGMFRSFAANIPALMKFVSFGAICGGAFMILRAILMLPQLQQGRVEGGKVIWLMISGVGLWSLLPLITASMSTMGMGTPDASNLLTAKYSQVSGGGFDGTIAAVMVFVQLLGLIAFVRGMLILKALGENKDGAMGRALTHIFGGAAAMNVAWTVKALAYSIGATSVICGLSTNLCA